MFQIYSNPLPKNDKPENSESPDSTIARNLHATHSRINIGQVFEIIFHLNRSNIFHHEKVNSVQHNKQALSIQRKLFASSNISHGERNQIRILIQGLTIVIISIYRKYKEIYCCCKAERFQLLFQGN